MSRVVYKDKNLKKVMKRVRLELGSQAYLIKHEVEKSKGFAGLSSKNVVVTIGVNGDIPGSISGEVVSTSSSAIKRVVQKTESTDRVSETELNAILANVFSEPSSAPLRMDAVNVSPKIVSSNSKDVNQLNTTVEMNEIRSMFKTLTESNQAPVTQTVVEKVYVNTEDALEHLLEDFDFSKEIKNQFVQYLQQNNISLNKATQKDLYDFVKTSVEDNIQVKEFDRDAKFHVFVGPPGVGKTTTIAKVASNELFYRHKKVGFITLDGYRIGAAYQLEKYADILKCPIYTVKTAEGFREALKELEDYDMVVIDTTGRTHRDDKNLEILHSMLQEVASENVYLVLNISMKTRELIKILDKFKITNYNQLILTKLDELERSENILNVSSYNKAPVTFMCSGQEVPFDIAQATKERLLNSILGGEFKC